MQIYWVPGETAQGFARNAAGNYGVLLTQRTNGRWDEMDIVNYWEHLDGMLLQ